jgi:hypothetical protein
MKYVISEKQLANLIVKQSLSDDLDYEHVSDANPENNEYVVGKEVDEQSEPPPTSSSGGDFSTSSGAGDYPPYPETGKWESGVTRGAANQVDTGSRWSDVVGSKLSRGHANPLK